MDPQTNKGLGRDSTWRVPECLPYGSCWGMESRYFPKQHRVFMPFCAVMHTMGAHVDGTLSWIGSKFKGKP